MAHKFYDDVELRGIVSEGSGEATGQYSHAEGRSIATEQYAHGEGCDSEANGKYSHAEGIETIAYGASSHTEGSGTTTGSYDDIDKGNCAHAEGVDTLATGTGAHAEGNGTQATGDNAHAEGSVTQATGTSSHAEGHKTQATGDYSHAEGESCLAKGKGSHAEGYQTIAHGFYSHAGGQGTVALGDWSQAYGYGEPISESSIFYYLQPENIPILWEGKDSEGNNVTTFHGVDITKYKESITIAGDSCAYVNGKWCCATKNYSAAIGEKVYVKAGFSIGFGSKLKITGAYSGSFGSENTITNSFAYAFGSGLQSTDTYQLICGYTNHQSNKGLFIVGKGGSANALRVTSSGVYGAGGYNNSGADYAEYFEWQDKNIQNEDRRGYFITLVDDKITIASPGDYILGVISDTASICGNNPEDWDGRYIRDKFGSFITETYEHEETITDPKTGDKKIINKIDTRYKQNPDYDPAQSYIERDKRPEWAAVGMLGVLHVRDDGTCQVNGYCKVADGGIATAAESGYRVVARTADNVIKIVFK